MDYEVLQKLSVEYIEGRASVGGESIMDEIEEQIMEYAERVNDWFIPQDSYGECFPERKFNRFEWDSERWVRRHRSLAKYGFLEKEIYHPGGTKIKRWHYRIKKVEI